MHYRLLFILPLLVSAWEPASTEGSDAIAAQSLQNLRDVVSNGTLKQHLATQGVSQTCNIENAAVRREYSTLSNSEKLAWTNSIKCLMAKPANVSSTLVPGARSRYDDFVATHINQTGIIHTNGPFLFWHRYFLWTFEQALRNECNYTGVFPYWNYGKSALDILNSPYLDGSEYSQGGNGVYEEHSATTVAATSGLPPIEPEQGGGCVETGPYAGIMANISATGPRLSTVQAGTLYSYEPRCIKRDISETLAKTWATDNFTVDLLTNSRFQTFETFVDRLDDTGNDTVGWLGLHVYGHFSVNGDPGGDLYNSPNEPMFWIHHANIDRLWSIWQHQKPMERTFAIAKTVTTGNVPPSANATMEDIVDMGDYVGGKSAIKYHVSTIGGQYCYIYE